MGRILLIDDAEFARMVLRRILQEYGYDICAEAGSGTEGIEKFKQLKPDLVFCDIRMKGMDGIRCLKEILAVDANAKVVICAAVSSPEAVRQAFEAGAKGIIEKPVQASRLISVTRRLIGEPGSTKSYKELMEERAEVAGLAGKPLLDFFAAFYSLCGFPLDDKQVDEEYLQKNSEWVSVGARALLSAKIPLEQIEGLENIFRGLTIQ